MLPNELWGKVDNSDTHRPQNVCSEPSGRMPWEAAILQPENRLHKFQILQDSQWAPFKLGFEDRGSRQVSEHFGVWIDVY